MSPSFEFGKWTNYISLHLGPELNSVGETWQSFLGKPAGATKSSTFSVVSIRLRHNFHTAFNKISTKLPDFLDSSILHKIPKSEAITPVFIVLDIPPRNWNPVKRLMTRKTSVKIHSMGRTKPHSSGKQDSFHQSATEVSTDCILLAVLQKHLTVYFCLYSPCKTNPKQSFQKF